MQQTRNAYAKINLTLDVTDRLPNGYHSVRMVMQEIDLHDTLTLTTNTSGRISIQSNLPYLPTDQRNLAVRAGRLFYEKHPHLPQGLHIDLVKRIPVAAGLAGGSTNAAAVLHGMNELYQTALSLDALCEMGLRLGADVPFCLRGGTMLAEGIGEVLSPLSPLPDCHIVLCKPPFPVSTPEVYQKMDKVVCKLHPDTDGMIAALRNADMAQITPRLYNVMEAVVGEQHAEIAEIRGILLQYGAQGAVMSGSGPSVFGIFRKKEQAEQAYHALKATYTDTFLTKPTQMA